MLNVLWVVLGVCSILVALVLCLVLLRLHRTLAVLEETLMTADAAMRELVPEVRGRIGNLNDLAAALNVLLRSASTGAARRTADLGGRSGGGAGVPEGRMRRAVQGGFKPARRRREELESEAGRRQPGIMDGNEALDV